MGPRARLEIKEDIGFQRRAWKFQRAGWVVLALAVVAAVLGAFGHGPLSHGTVMSGSGRLWLEYERVDRYDTPSILRVHIGAGVVQDGHVRLQFNDHYLANVQIQEMTPEPISSEASAEGTIYIFRLAEPNRPSQVTFLIKIQQIGFLSGHLRLSGEPSLAFRQFIYP